MEAQFDREHERDERRPPAAAKAPEAPEAMKLASQIGNQGVQRVAGSPALQRSPAAAPLVRGRLLARQEDEEAAENAPEAGAAEPAAEAGNENAPAEGAEAAGSENAPEAGGNENAEAGGTENAAPEAGGGNENEEVPEEEAA